MHPISSILRPALTLATTVLCCVACADASGPSADADGADAASSAPSPTSSATTPGGGGTTAPGAVAVTAVAAAPSEAPSPPGACVADALPTMCLHLTLTGALAFDGDLVDLTPSALDCGTWAAGGSEMAGPDAFSLPALNQPPPGGPAMTLFVNVSSYAGPGSYDVAQFTWNGSPAAILIDDAMYEVGPGTVGTATIDSAGGGQLQLAGLTSVASPDPLDLSLNWSCQQPA